MKLSTLTACALLVVALAGQAFGGSSERGLSERSAIGRAGASIAAGPFPADSGFGPGRGFSRSENLYRGHTARYWHGSTKGQAKTRRERERTIHRLANRVSQLRFELRETRRMLRGVRRERGELAKRLAELEGGTGGGWAEAWVTSYATWEPGLSNYTACPSPYGTLDNYGYTVAVHYGIGLDGENGLPACGTKIVLTDGRRFHVATVTDRTLSKYSMELSYALSRVFGAPEQTSGWLTWSGNLRWRRA